MFSCVATIGRSFAQKSLVLRTRDFWSVKLLPLVATQQNNQKISDNFEGLGILLLNKDCGKRSMFMLKREKWGLWCIYGAKSIGPEMFLTFQYIPSYIKSPPMTLKGKRNFWISPRSPLNIQFSYLELSLRSYLSVHSYIFSILQLCLRMQIFEFQMLRA